MTTDFFFKSVNTLHNSKNLTYGDDHLGQSALRKESIIILASNELEEFVANCYK